MFIQNSLRWIEFLLHKAPPTTKLEGLYAPTDQSGGISDLTVVATDHRLIQRMAQKSEERYGGFEFLNF